MAYDRNVVPLTTVTTSQDLIVATGAAAVTRLGIGSEGQVLKVVSGALAYAADTAGGTSHVVTKTTAYTTTYGEVVLCDASGAGFTVTLPAAANDRQEITVKKVDSVSANVVTISPASGTIDGAATKTISVQYNSFTLVSDGTDWFIL